MSSRAGQHQRLCRFAWALFQSSRSLSQSTPDMYCFVLHLTAVIHNLFFISSSSRQSYFQSTSCFILSRELLPLSYIPISPLFTIVLTFLVLIFPFLRRPSFRVSSCSSPLFLFLLFFLHSLCGSFRSHINACGGLLEGRAVQDLHSVPKSNLCRRLLLISLQLQYKSSLSHS